MEKTTVSDCILKVLHLLEVKYLYAINGANIEHFIDRCLMDNNYPKPILVKREDTASYAADFQSRYQANISACCATSGAGLMNLLPGIAESFSNKSAIFAVIGQPDSNDIGEGAFQDTSGMGRTPNAFHIFNSCTKYCAEIKSVEDVFDNLNEALEHLLTGTPGPIALLINRNVFDKPMAYVERYWQEKINKLRKPQLFNNNFIASSIKKRINKSQNPVIVLGQEAKWILAKEELDVWLTKLNCPVILTITARGLIKEDRDYFYGLLGIIGSQEALEFLKHEADLILCIGTELNRCTFLDFDKWEKVIYISGWGEDLLFNKPVSDRVLCSIQSIIPLLDNSNQRSLPEENPAIRWNKNLNQYSNGKYDYISVAYIINQYLSRFDNVIYDAGNCASFLFRYTNNYNLSNQHIALGMGGMGYSFAASVAYSICEPQKNCLVFSGDGAFFMSGLEIHTVIQNGGNVLYCIFNDGAHGMCKTRQDLYFNNRHVCSEYSPINISTLAKGIHSNLFIRRVQNLNELYSALEEYFLVNGVGVIEIVFNDCNLIPPFIPFKKKGD